jgi:hypothetical protein
MGWWLFKIIIYSLFVVIGIHYTYEYIKNTYSSKITKDIVGFQTKKYKEMMEEILQSSREPEFLNENEKQNMENDLAEFVSNYDS